MTDAQNFFEIFKCNKIKTFGPEIERKILDPKSGQRLKCGLIVASVNEETLHPFIIQKTREEAGKTPVGNLFPPIPDGIGKLKPFLPC